MDLLDFAAENLYFDEPSSAEVTRLLGIAADAYGTPKAENALLRAYFQGPENLTVLVGLYRYYYYQRRYEDALEVAERCLRVVAARLGMVDDWRRIDADDLALAAQSSMTLLRLYLYALKGAAYLELRIERPAAALQRLELIARFDRADRIGVQPLVVLARDALGAGSRALAAH